MTTRKKSRKQKKAKSDRKGVAYRKARYIVWGTFG